MSIQKEIILRYKAAGHIRLQLPDLLCRPNIASVLEKAIARLDGVYRVKLYRKQGKLSIRYVEEICPFDKLLSKLFDMLEELEKIGFPKEQSAPSASGFSELKDKVSRFRPARWAKEKYTETKETAQAVGILARFGLKNKNGIFKDPEKTLVDFFNDVLVLYLVKTHWHIITQHWLLKPLRYRYEWMASFYMMYLLMRSKMKK